MTGTQRKQRTITLTGRSPVTINEDEWPVIAGSGWGDNDRPDYEPEANRRADATLRVRQHTDGRTLVYGTYRYRTNFQGEDDVRAAAGVLLDAEGDIPAAVASTMNTLCTYNSLPREWQPDWRLLADECVADLPAETL